MKVRRKIRQFLDQGRRRRGWAIAGVMLGIAAIAAIAGLDTLMTRGADTDEASVAQTQVPDPFSEIDVDRMAEGMLRLDVRLEPTFTSTPRPTRTPRPTATPQPMMVSAPAQAVAGAAGPSEPEACAASMSGSALGLFNSMNSERAARGLGPLASDLCVTYVAQGQAAAMASAGVLSHAAGGDSFAILRSWGVGFGWAGENIARNTYPSSQSVPVTMRTFMHSASHRDNILNSNFSRAGVGVARSSGGVTYFAVVFVGS